MSYAYAYLVMVSFLGLTWLVLFLLRRDLRYQQMFVSLCTAPLAFTQVFWFYKDYWRPEYIWPLKVYGVPFGIEEILFAFFIGGIGSVLYEAIFRKRYRAGRKRIKETAGIILFSAFIFIALLMMGLVSIWASSIALAVASVIMILIDRDIRSDWIMSSVGMFSLITGIYLVWFTLFPDAVSKLWLSSGLSGYGFLGIPIEETVWYVSWAMFSGVAYEFMVNAGSYSKLQKFKTTLHRRAKI